MILKIMSTVDADELKESRDLIKRIRKFYSQALILKMLLKNNRMPVNREGESEDREKEKAQRLI
ncbi:hypothetical protein HanRHA438_Chr13g0590341 [Helianthus annuus]|nr:hypothetical protein HanRHA438_Chr13g0590341 [Helianthus annuus]